jgi:hypothetical protein
VVFRQNFSQAVNILLLLVIFFLYSLMPYIAFNDLKDTITSSNFICGSFLISSAGLLLILRIFLSQKSVARITIFDLGLLLLVIYICINRYLLHSIQPHSLFFSELILTTVLYFILKGINRKNLMYLLFASIIGASFQIILGYMQLFGYADSNNHYFKVTGSFFNPGPYSCYLACVIPVIVGFYFYLINYTSKIQAMHIGETLMKWILLAIGVLDIFMLSIAGSRTALLAALMGLSSLAGGQLYREWAGYTWLKRGIILLSSAVLFTGLYFVKQDSADGRILIWKISRHYLSKHPYNGSGYGLFQPEYMKEQASYFSQNHDIHEQFISDNVYYAYNETLEFIFENGIVGGLMLLAVIFTLLKIKGNSLIKKIGIAGLTTCGIIAQFSYPSQILPIRLMMILYLVLVVRHGKCVWTFDFQKPVPAVRIILLGLLTSCFLANGVYTGIIYQAYRKWNTGDMIMHTGNYLAAQRYYQSLYTELAHNGSFLLDYGSIHGALGNNRNAINIYSISKSYVDNAPLRTHIGESYALLHQTDSAEANYVIAVNMCPYKIYPKYRLLQLYIRTEQKDKALQIIKTIQHNKLKVESSAGNDILRDVRSIADSLKLK